MSEVVLSAALGSTESGQLFAKIVFQDDITERQETNLSQTFVVECVGVPYEFAWRFIGNELQFLLVGTHPEHEEEVILAQMVRKVTGKKDLRPEVDAAIHCFIAPPRRPAAAA